MFRSFFFIVSVFTVSFASLGQNPDQNAEDVVHLVSDLWCPYNCEAGSDKQGLFYDIVAASFDNVGMQVTFTNTSWNRAIVDTERGAYDVLLGATPRLASNLTFYPHFTLNDETVFAFLPESNVTIDTIEDLNKYSLGRLSDYSYVDDVAWETAIQNHNTGMALRGQYGEARLFDLLVRKRVDVVAVNINVAKQYLQQNPDVKMEFIRKGFSLGAFIAFPKTDRGNTIHQKFDEGFRALVKADGLEAIHKKYGVELFEAGIDVK